MDSLFATAMTLREIPAGADGPTYEAELNQHWTIGPKVHGGVMVALCANAARTAYGDLLESLKPLEPVAVSANFLRAPDPGAMRLTTSIRKRGRRISVVEVELTQNERPAVHAVVTLSEPEHDHAPLLTANPVLDLMAPEPPDGVEPILPGHPLAGLVHLGAGCDIRPLLSTLGPANDRHPPLIQMWARPRNAATDVLFALLCGDLSAPVTFAVDRTGWAPTVQFTSLVRGRPANGWLRVICTCTEIGQEWFDEDHIVVDEAGRLVVQSRQLAMVPAKR